MKRAGYWIGTGLLMMMLGGSISLNIALWEKAEQYYKESNATRLDPIGLGVYKEESLPIRSNNMRVVMIGDSRIRAWPAPELVGYEFVNRGISSQTSIQVLSRFESHVVALRPDIIVIQVGINDIKTIGLFPDNAQEILDNTRDNITKLVKQAENTGATVVLSSVLPAGKITLARRPFWSDDIDTAVVEMNEYLQLLAQSNETDSVIWFDAYEVIVDEQGRMKAAYRQDELHLNEQGYEALNQAFVSWLKARSPN